jgi:hypothetical protein
MARTTQTSRKSGAYGCQICHSQTRPLVAGSRQLCRSGSSTDYDEMSAKMLRTELRIRNVSLLGITRKSQYIERLRATRVSNQQPDYDAMTANMLRAALQDHDISLTGMTRKDHYFERLKPLDESRRRLRERIHKAQDNMQRLHDYIEMIKARPNQTLESSFQEEPARISFTDLQAKCAT